MEQRSTTFLHAPRELSAFSRIYRKEVFFVSLLIDELDFDARRARFRRIAEETAIGARTQGLFGFGTLQEKRLHAALKNYLCENADFHEAGIEGTRFLADLRLGNEIYEVQTGSFAPLKPKLEHLLKNTPCTVTVVHPLIVRRAISWIDPRNGSVSPARRTGGIESPIQLLADLYPLLDLLPDERLSFRLLSLSVCDFRLLNPDGRDPKRHTRRYERVPLDLLGDVTYSAPSDFCDLLPADLPRAFTVPTFSKCTHLHGIDAYSATRVLAKLGILRQTSATRPMKFEVV